MYEIPFGRPMISEEERAAVAEVLQGNILVHGPKSKEFEASFGEFTKADHAVSVSSCTAGLHLAYFSKGIKEGDEVIVPAQTHTATAHAVEYVGAKPVFVDAELTTGNIDLDKIEEAITSNTKAISVVHYLGMPVDMERVCAIAKKHDLFVVEDCALSVGGTFKKIHTGLWGDIGCFSFYPVKHMTTAEGGMCITKHEDLAEQITKRRAFGLDRVVGTRKMPGIYDVTMLGFNYRMNEIEAAIGVEQVKKLNSILEDRKANYEALESHLKEIDGLHLFQSSSGDFQSSYYCLSVVLDDELAERRAEIVTYLKERGVGTSVYYPRAVPMMSYYQEKYGYKAGDYPNAERISNQSIALPVGPHLNVDDMKTVASMLDEAIKATATTISINQSDMQSA
jgi:perosamine synthetase